LAAKSRFQRRVVVATILFGLATSPFAETIGWLPPPTLMDASIEGQDTATPAAALTATDLLARASRRLAETESIRFELDVEGITFLDTNGQIRLLEAKGELLRPDRVSTSFKAEALGQVISINLIAVGDRAWTTDLLSGNWGEAPQEFAYRPSILFDQKVGIGPVMDQVSDAVRLPDEELEGEEMHRVRAVVDAAVIDPMTYSTITGSPITVDLWIDPETDDLVRARLAEPANDIDPAVWTLDFSAHGEEVSIEPPI